VFHNYATVQQLDFKQCLAERIWPVLRN